MALLRTFPAFFVWLLAATPAAAQGPANFSESQAFLKTYCQKCHEGKTAVGGFKLERMASQESLGTEAHKWTSAGSRVRNGEMPPKGSPAPSIEEREAFAQWVETALHQHACADGVAPGPSPIRRLNRDEYAATIRDLFDIHLDIGRMLPADGAGGEGFDNAAETLFLSPLHSEKYLEVAKFATNFAAKEFKSRNKVITARPEKGVSPDRAAQQVLREFLPRAFRRPIVETEIAPYLTLFQAATKQGQPYEEAIFYALRGVLVSPNFLYRVEPANHTGKPRQLDQFALASRLSYFLWGSMPDELLFDIAAKGKLQDEEVLRQIIPVMLRNDRSLGFTYRFVEQWLRTRELSTDKAPDAKLFPQFASDEELRSDIRYQPILFLRELLIRNMPITNLIDSKYTISTSNLNKHYGVEMPIRKAQNKQPQWVEVPEGSHRGGLLGMSAVLAVSSYPYRTSPVLRGAWILDSLLGTPPPPPPPNVPALEEAHDGTAPRSMRERLSQHRTNPVCASCHNRLDPIGFALENYDPIGRWRDQEGGKAIDASGELPDHTKFQGPDELKKALLDRKDLLLRNLTRKMLGYALGRGLTLKDSCTVDAIVASVKEKDYRGQALIEGIVLSAPFRYQAAAALAPPPTSTTTSNLSKEPKKP